MKIYKPTPLKNLSWSQAKSRFPLMKPFGDADKDGVKNFRDCKPFDIKRQGEKHRSSETEFTGEDISKAIEETLKEKEERKESYERMNECAKMRKEKGW